MSLYPLLIRFTHLEEKFPSKVFYLSPSQNFIQPPKPTCTTYFPFLSSERFPADQNFVITLCMAQKSDMQTFFLQGKNKVNNFIQ